MAEDASIDADDKRTIFRREMKTRRSALPAGERLRAGVAVAETLLHELALADMARVAGYWSIAGELPLHTLVPRLPASCIYHLPRLGADGRLRFAAWRPGEALECNRYGIPEPDRPLADCLEPERLDLVLVPLLAFDRRGHRLGMGAGWYDRSFSGRRGHGPPPRLVGVGYAFQEIEHVPEHDGDVPLDAVVTEREFIECRR